MIPVIVRPGDSPVILAQPHGGIWLPDTLLARLNDRGRTLSDTDWHIDQLYDGLLPAATIVRATFHRYVIDANRDPTGQSLYPGQNTTDLCPTTDFDGHPIWAEGQEPYEDEVVSRLARYHAPYHAALAAEVARVRDRHGVAILWDCHSIRSNIPFLFDGELPIFNIGTNSGATCAPLAQSLTVQICRESEASVAVNGRFKGGWTTRHYGRPEIGVHAIQMELAQRAYLTDEAPPWAYSDSVAGSVRPALAKILHALDETGRTGRLT